MTEIIEYAFVFLTSSLVVGFSVAGYSGYASVVSADENRAAFTRFEALAWAAIENGAANGTLQLSGASLSCSGGELSLTSQGYSGAAQIPRGCRFSFVGLDGVHLLSLTANPTSLFAAVE